MKIRRLTCFRKLVIVFCISETKSWKSLIEGSVLFLEVTVTFTGRSTASSDGLHRQMKQKVEVTFQGCVGIPEYPSRLVLPVLLDTLDRFILLVAVIG